jgi:hypothetical protein
VHASQVRYVIARILCDRASNESPFKNCFEMEDGDELTLAILRRGLKNPKLHAALEASIGQSY